MRHAKVAMRQRAGGRSRHTNPFTVPILQKQTAINNMQALDDDNMFDQGPSLNGIMQAKKSMAAAPPAGGNTSTARSGATSKQSNRATSDDAIDTASESEAEDAGSEADNADPQDDDSGGEEEQEDGSDASISNANDSDFDDGDSGTHNRAARGAGAASKAGASKKTQGAAHATTTATPAGTPAAVEKRKQRRGPRKQGAPSTGVQGEGALPFPGNNDSQRFEDVALAAAEAGKTSALVTRAVRNSSAAAAQGANQGYAGATGTASGTLRPPSDADPAFCISTMHPAMLTDFFKVLAPALAAMNKCSTESPALQMFVTNKRAFQGIAVDMLLGGDKLLVDAKLAVTVEIFAPPPITRVGDGDATGSNGAAARRDKPPSEVPVLVNPTVLLATLATIRPYAELCMYANWSRDRLYFMTRDTTGRIRYRSIVLKTTGDVVDHKRFTMPRFDFDVSIPVAELKNDVGEAIHARASEARLQLRVRKPQRSWLFCVSADTEEQTIHNVLPIWAPETIGTDDANSGIAACRGEFRTMSAGAMGNDDAMPESEAEVEAMPCIYSTVVECNILQAILKNISEELYITVAVKQNEPLVISTNISEESFVTFVINSSYADEENNGA
jgi:hypothetical protein